MDTEGDGLADEETLTCTGEHPFWGRMEWTISARRFGVLANVGQQLGRLDRDSAVKKMPEELKRSLEKTDATNS